MSKPEQHHVADRDGKARLDQRVLRNVAHGRPDRQGIGPEHADRAGLGGEQAQDQLDEGGLAGSVGADDGQKVSGLDGQVHVREHLPPVIVEADATQFDDWRAGTRRAGNRQRLEAGLRYEQRAMPGARGTGMVG